jgi:ferrochelatase
VQALCPGFSADCLETVDEVGREARHTFLQAGGDKFTYIPALNDRADHLRALTAIILEHLWSGRAEGLPDSGADLPNAQDLMAGDPGA